ncbi:DUF2294 domain-containing protein [Nodosilinea sp. LEGE 07088]|uniref:DUF2294 domain-containing protein n=1 Tax=Nodosilinea sp. LEGE 07088 TaxID=2777968 RepID=UPI0018818E15|nr:DUF2294 domain-containing protein [Nodosilinea sp. LEGE 07088]MBE9136677.1 DUF2294 domain-containing protein [Nodosilinea sp. LEGE 07088]
MAADTSSSPPTLGQLQRNLSQQFQRLYREQLGHAPGKITCQILEEKLLLIVEKSVTKPEQLLIEEGQAELAEQVRDDLATALRPQIIDLVETTLARQVEDILTDSTLATGRTSIVVILSAPPDVRAAKNQD